MMHTFAAICGTALVLYLLYKTDAVFSYLSSPMLAWLNPITKIKEFKKQFGASDGQISYSDFMLGYHSNFFIKTISCRYCFGVWLALAASLMSGTIKTMPIVYFGGQLLCTTFDWIERKLNDG